MGDSGVITSWRRLSDRLSNDVNTAGAPNLQVRPARLKEARQLEAWEGEGGQPARSTEPVRILIVDIDMKSSHSLELLLQAAGYSQTRVAYSGHAALAIAEDFQPSVVLVELNLFDMSGYELARLLRGHAPNRDLRLIAMTSSREYAGRELARVLGFERYLCKPVVGASLLNVLQTPSAPD
jgi:PleD family two-component response regulator